MINRKKYILWVKNVAGGFIPYRLLHVKGGKGFTLIETLLAILILAVAIAGPLTIASKSLSSASVAKNRATAIFLAQDAIEYIRFVRDTNRLAGGDWLTGAGGDPTKVTDLSLCETNNGSGNVCYFDTLGNNPTSIQSCGGSATDCAAFPMYYSNTTNSYTYDTTATRTPFTRTVNITTPVGSNGNEALVTVTVTWTDAGGLVSRSIVIKDNLFSWQ